MAIRPFPDAAWKAAGKFWRVKKSRFTKHCIALVSASMKNPVLPHPLIMMRNASVAASCLALLTPSLLAQDANADDSIIQNGSMEVDEDGNNWPDGWPATKSADLSWEEEDGNHFIRIVSSEAGKMTMLYREIPIPPGVEAIEFSWKQRVNELTIGEEEWFDARIMLEFLDSERQAIPPFPQAQFERKASSEWERKSMTFEVPAGAALLKFMPALYKVNSGQLDIDDVVLRPVSL